MPTTFDHTPDDTLAHIYLGYAEVFSPHRRDVHVGQWAAIIDEINSRSSYGETVDAWVRRHMFASRLRP